MNLITLADARAFLKPHVDNGSCSTSLIDDRIAEIEERLAPEVDPGMAIRKVRVLVRNRQFCLPLNVTRICAADVDGVPVALGSSAYEFLSSGPGDLDLGRHSCKNVIDAGEHATQFDIPVQRVSDSAWSSGLKLAAFSVSKDDAALTLTARGYDSRGDEVRTVQGGAMTPGEVLAINRWSQGVEGQIVNMSAQAMSTGRFASVSRVYKPVTSAAVTLYAYDPSTHAMYMLAKIEPDATVPSYRRYKLTGVSEPVVNSDKEIVTDCVSALLLVKVGWTRATRATDVLFVQSLSALKFGAKALTAESAGDLNAAVGMWGMAVGILKKKQEDRDGDVTVPSVWDIDVSTSLADVNHGYLV